jgi:thiamine monophosphate synthase
MKSGVGSVAVVRAIIADPNPEAAVQRLKELLQS